MSYHSDYSWGKERVTDTHKTGNIVTIPVDPDNNKKDDLLDKELHTDMAIDEFKEKVAKVLSQELHKDD